MDPLGKLKDLAISDSGFVFDPYSGSTFTVNPTGLAIINGLKEELSREGVIRRVKEQFDVQEGDLHRDLDEFLHLLRENDIVPQDFVLE